MNDVKEIRRVAEAMDIVGIHPSLKMLVDAARAYVELVESGPDYEAAWECYYELADRRRYPGLTALQVRSVVDAALAVVVPEEANGE